MPFPRSDHCNGKTFFYPGPMEMRSFRDVLRWKFGSRPAKWPKRVELPVSPPPPKPQGNEIVVTWINHATFLLQTSHGNFLTDPVFSKRCSPSSWFGPKRVHAPGIALEDLPKIDAILLSHDHYDHCDLRSLRRLHKLHEPVVLAPLGHAALLAPIKFKRVIELDWWQSHEWAPGVSIILTPSQHWCRRRIGGTNERLWGGFYLQNGDHRLHFVGDTGYDPYLFFRIKRKLGAPNVALIPIGAYEPRWFMKSSHVNPAEAVQIHRDLEARQSVAMHWGTFQLTDEAREDPPEFLRKVLAAEGLSPESFRVIDPGQSLTS